MINLGTWVEHVEILENHYICSVKQKLFYSRTLIGGRMAQRSLNFEGQDRKMGT